MNRRSVSIGVVVAVLLVACENAPTPQFDPELPTPYGEMIALRGEEGVPVVERDSPLFLSFDSDSNYFHGVADAVRLQNNTIAVANEFSSEIFLFDSAGKFVRSIGRRGSGPGEFERVNSLIALGDGTMVAFDRQTRRVARFTAAGDLLDDHRVDGPAAASPIGSATLVGASAPDRLLIWSQAMPTEDDLNLPPNKPAAIPEIPFTVDASGKSPLMIGKFPGNDLWISDASGMELLYGLAPFGRRTWFGTIGGKAVVLRNTEPAFRVYLKDGSPYAIYRGNWRARKVTQHDRDQFMANWFVRLRKESYWNKLEELTQQAFPATTPYFRDAIIGTDAVVWIEPYDACCGDERVYFGYDSTSIAVGKLVLPGGDRVLEIGNGVLIATRPEELGTERVYVQRYRLGPGQTHAASSASVQQ